MKASGGVTKQELDVAAFGGLVGLVTKRCGIRVVLPADHFDLQAFGPDGELLDGRGTEGVGRCEQHGVAVALEVGGELGRGGGLARAVDADDQNRFRLRGQGTDWRRLNREDTQDFFAGNFHHVLGGDGLGLSSCLERVHDPQAHRDAEVAADEHLLEFIPIDRFAGKFLNE